MPCVPSHLLSAAETTDAYTCLSPPPCTPHERAGRATPKPSTPAPLTSPEPPLTPRSRATDLETYNTQEGFPAGLRKIIIANVPAKILVELENTESGLDEVKPRRLLETIKRRAAPVTCLNAMTVGIPDYQL